MVINPAEEVELSVVQVDFGWPVQQGAGAIRFYFLTPLLFLSLSSLFYCYYFFNQVWGFP